MIVKSIVVDNNTFNVEFYAMENSDTVDIQLNIMKFKYDNRDYYTINYELYYNIEDLVSNGYLTFLANEDLESSINHIVDFLAGVYEIETEKELFNKDEYNDKLQEFIYKNK